MYFGVNSEIARSARVNKHGRLLSVANCDDIAMCVGLGITNNVVLINKKPFSFSSELVWSGLRLADGRSEAKVNRHGAIG